MRGNTVTIEMPMQRGKVGKTIPLYQYDYGQKLIITGIDLPTYYEVHFSNELHGEAVTSIGDSTGVDIPDDVLTTGQPIYLWLFLHETGSDGETEFQGAIPVIKRASISDVEPTPAQQTVIEQAIAALNAGVTEVEEAVEGIEDTIEAALTEAKESGEFDGVSPTVEMTPITNGYQLSITDASGTSTASIMNGEDGDPGTPGADGFSPTASVSKSGSVATISITDKVGTTTVQVNDGETGPTPEFSIGTVTTGEPGTDASATITGTAEYPELNLTIPQGADGDATVDDTAGDGDTTHVWSADKLVDEFGKKTDKVASAVSGNFAGLDSNGNLVDSGHKHGDYLTAHQDISGKADKVANASNGHFASLDSNGNLVDSGHKPSDYITSHQDISGKADKVSSATNGNFAGLDSNGNLVDSGHKHSDYVTDISGKADKANPVFTGSMSMGRLADTNIGNCSVAIGADVSAIAEYSHAEGRHTVASGSGAHAEGYYTEATQSSAHAEGGNTSATGARSHAEGKETWARGANSHAEGYGTVAHGRSQHVSGEYNVPDEYPGEIYRAEHIEVVGNGESDALSNARTLDWNGNERLKGDLYINCDADSTNGTSVGTALSNLNERKADIIHDTASGSIATFQDGADSLPMAVTAEIVPVQDLHGQESPWPGGGGKNKFNATKGTQTQDGITVTISDNGAITVTGTSSLASGYTSFTIGTIDESVVGNACSTSISEKVVGVGVTFGSNNGSINFTLSQTATKHENQEYTRGSRNVTLNVNYDVSNINKTFYIQLEVGSSATAWSPYSNVCPISGWDSANITGTGANLAKFTDGTSTISGATVAISNGIISLNGTTNNMLQIRSGAFTVVPGDSLTLSGCPSGGDPTTYRIDIRLASDASLINVGYDTGSGLTFTVPTGVTSIIICVRIVSGVNVSGLVFKPVIGKTSERTSHPITFPSTVYGGTVKVNKDGSRKLTAGMDSDTIGSLSWDYNGTRFRAYIATLTAEATRLKGICSIYPVFNGSISDAPDKSMIFSNQTKEVYIKDSSYSTPEALVSGVGSGQIVFKLATPVEIDLTDSDAIVSMLGVNNVWADCGAVTVEYPADTKLYIDKKLSASRNLMELIITANHEDSMKATKAYNAGNLLIVAGTLYKATTSIANGATITVGTNVTATTVAAELVALA